MVDPVFAKSVQWWIQCEFKFRRLKGDKIFHNIEPTYAITRQSELKLFIKHTRTNVGKYVYANRIAPIWNKLVPKVQEAKNRRKSSRY
jgi:hypothetical protein